MDDSTRTNLSKLADKLVDVKLALREYLIEDVGCGVDSDLLSVATIRCRDACDLIAEIKITPGDSFEMVKYLIQAYERLDLADWMLWDLSTNNREGDFAKLEPLYVWARTMIEISEEAVSIGQRFLESLGSPKPDKEKVAKTA
ncbi:MAG: hypothetical protein OXF02_07465 [Simkaniaceae bacterium]|nr:hypothetical protein [Simkaniaceae bacterium]